ncbi:site-specific integrase [Spongiactinospora gelatinilytica]|uniref:Site-specific integrase n=1 Tax=Spongiactinospora gelatinilytica TaxID=2666298 RepID=A0A2W2IXF6_9ACTN|nr:site-specific integrase [Spongiactinospora gelatinilytica]PZG54324.1 site-specific integrase [Spongiactinospora gelatinilytica]
MASIKKRPDGKWRARFRDDTGKEHAKHFARKVDAQAWLDEKTASLVTGTYVDPKTARVTVAEWCATWLEGYATRRSSTVRQARVHIAQIVTAFGPMKLSAVRPSHVKSWTARLRGEGRAESYVYALHARLAQIMGDAVHDGIIPRSPCSRRTSPGAGKQRAYVATTAQVWALYDAMPERFGAAVLLGAFVGLRIAEACGLRVADIDFMRGVVHPRVQYPVEPLKTEISRTSVPIPQSLAAQLSAHVAEWPGETLLTNDRGEQLGPWALEREMRKAREKVHDLPTGFRFHDLRHYLASLLIASGADVKVVQARLRHASAKTTLDTYGHLWPDSDESTRAALDAVLQDRADSLRTQRIAR